MTATAAARSLIVNADDFGQSPGVNAGVIAAHERGIVSSASLMTRWPAAPAAAAYARNRPALDLGLHIDLGEWWYRDGDWLPLYHVVDTEDEAAVRAEVARQIAEFRRLTGHDPSHLDSHQHVHRREPARSVIIAAAREIGVPLRECTPGIRYVGGFYGQTGEGAPLPEAITLEALLRLVDRLEPGVTELGCHPGLAVEAELETMYRAERAEEVSVLCDRRVREYLARNGVALRSFAGLGSPLARP